MNGTGINPDAFSDVAMTVLRFSFRGSRKTVASHLCITSQLDEELKTHASLLLNALYGERVVRKVEIMTYGNGRWATDDWPEGLELLDEAGTKTTLSVEDDESVSP